MGNIFHLTPAEFFNRLPKTEPFLPAEYSRDGFIHCTKEPEMMLQVANRFYRQVDGDMLVLVIDEARVTAEIRYEPPEPGGHLFPHIYGPLNRDAILELRTAVRASDGAYLSV